MTPDAEATLSRARQRREQVADAFLKRCTARQSEHCEHGQKESAARCISCVIAEATDLLSLCEALRADAERYRWLRDNTVLRDRGYGPEGRWLEIAEGLPWTQFEGSESERIDAAIDAARRITADYEPR